MTKYRVLDVMSVSSGSYTRTTQSLFQYVLPPLDGTHRDPQHRAGDDGQSTQAEGDTRDFPEGLQQHGDGRVVRHGVRDERLKIIGDRQPLQIAGKQQNSGFPSER